MQISNDILREWINSNINILNKWIEGAETDIEFRIKNDLDSKYFIGSKDAYELCRMLFEQILERIKVWDNADENEIVKNLMSTEAKA